MEENNYNKVYQSKEYDVSPDNGPQKPKKPSFLKVLLVGLLILFVCSLCYDNILKPYLNKREQQTENPDNGGYTEKEVQEIADDSWDKETSDIEEDVMEEKEIQETSPVKKQAQRDEQIEEEPKRELSTSELLERQSHANMVREAKRVGVSTEGTTSEIMDRITHANMVREAKRVGVSTEGSTSVIMDRITHENMVREAKRLGVSTEGTTSEIMDRITRKQLENLDW